MKDSLKILMFGWEYAPVVTGGLGVVCRDISEHLAGKGVTVKFVLPRFNSDLNDTEIDLIDASQIDSTDQIEMLALESWLTPYNSFPNNYRTNDSLGAKTERDIYGADLFDEILRYSIKAAPLAQNEDFDLIHAHDWMTFPAAINAQKISKKPLIVHIHSTEFDRSGGNPHPQIAYWEKRGMIEADKVIAVSEMTKNMIVEKYEINPAKIEVVHNSISKSVEQVMDSAIASDPPTVLFLGRMVIQKGADYLLRAAAKVVEYMPDVRFVFVGTGHMLSELIELTIKLGLSKNVVFTGYMSHAEVDKAYSQADLFVMPSVSEPFGITSLEAIKNGTPVIISKQSGASEVLHNCLKVNYWDIEELSNQILAVLSYKTLSDSLITNSCTDLEKLDWDTQTDKIMDIYHKFG